MTLAYTIYTSSNLRALLTDTSCGFESRECVRLSEGAQQHQRTESSAISGDAPRHARAKALFVADHDLI